MTGTVHGVQRRAALHRLAATAAAATAAALQAGCARYYYGGAGMAAAGSADLVEASRAAADALLQAAPLAPGQAVIVATVVDAARLNESSRLGRLLAEQIGGRFTQRGLGVREPRLRTSVLLRQQTGELLLSRELRDVSQQQAVQAVVVGTYAVAASTVYVSLKLLRPADGVAIAAHDIALPIDADVRALLAR